MVTVRRPTFPAIAALICVVPEAIANIRPVVGWTTATSGKVELQVTGRANELNILFRD
jgi:hypothetical protein